MRILIIKTSSLGDVVQAFDALHALYHFLPGASIDWAVEESLAPIVSAHPLLRRTIPLPFKELKRGWFCWGVWKRFFQSLTRLREEVYDVIFDLQGNSKSGIVTFLAKGRQKVGLGVRSVREWPNLLATTLRFEIPKTLNIRLQHIQLVQRIFPEVSSPLSAEGVRFTIEEREKQWIETLLRDPRLNTPLRIMVCPGSKWANKQLPLETLAAFLLRLRQELGASFLLVWGQEAERTDCLELQARLPHHSYSLGRLSFPLWQNLMSEIDLVFAVDSSALHVCGTTSTPSFSVFGPTSSEVFKPLGAQHYAVQGKCPYGRAFAKTCPILRTCPTAACIRTLSPDELFHSFLAWWQSFSEFDTKKSTSRAAYTFVSGGVLTSRRASS